MTKVLRRLGRPTVQAELVRAGAGAVSFVLLARLLGADGFGRLALVALGVGLLQPLLTPSLGLVLVRASAAGTGERRLVAQHARACLRATLVAGPVSLLVTSTGVLDLPLHVLWLLLWSELGCLGMLGGLAAIAQGRQDFARYRDMVVLAGMVRVAAVGALVLVADPDLERWAAALALVSTPVAVAAACWTWARSLPVPAAPRPRPDDVWVFSVNALAVRLFDDADKALVAAYAGYAAAGVYTAAYRLASYVLVPVRAVLAEFAPALFARGGGQEPDWSLVRAAVGRALLAAVVVAPPLCLAAVLAPRVLGAEYQDMAPLALVLVPALALRGVQYVLGDVLTATGRVRRRLAAQTACLVVPLGACVLLVPPLGAWGAVAASVLGELLAVGLLWAWARRGSATPGPVRSTVAVPA